ncbi:hypothetical protein [Thermococcus barophilus]|uniref:Uncharacterized protein n=1 Tax=Thermococcus barophilus TaxID=55802 RepID=A0A0S1XD91_THEBA|nr:hypothetical protein [Thermococcus barophilus]ALM75746.1 hypothetical protein TBCH5v1_1837 [Thermococcus barophilus]
MNISEFSLMDIGIRRITQLWHTLPPKALITFLKTSSYHGQLVVDRHMHEANIKFSMLLALWEQEINAIPEVPVKTQNIAKVVDIAFVHDKNLVFIETKSKLFKMFDQLLTYLLVGDFIIEVAPRTYENLDIVDRFETEISNARESFHHIFASYLRDKLGDREIMKLSVIASEYLGRYLGSVESGEIIELSKALRNPYANSKQVKKLLTKPISKISSNTLHDYVRGIIALDFLQNNFNIAFEFPLKSIEESYLSILAQYNHPFARSDRVYLPKNIRKIRRIDMVAWKDNEIIGIEVKTPNDIIKNEDNVAKQIATYLRAYEIDKLYLAVPDISPSVINKAEKLCSKLGIELLMVHIAEREGYKQTNLNRFFSLE